ncbi:beta-ketoacyl reductase [Streptomyces thinghirensis]|nr:beta-ketoacyl reductase [Streptomyces thinghirensis]
MRPRQRRQAQGRRLAVYRGRRVPHPRRHGARPPRRRGTVLAHPARRRRHLVGPAPPPTSRGHPPAPALARRASPSVPAGGRTDRDAVRRSVADVVSRPAPAVHCAEVLRDGYLATKSDGDLTAVLAPKTTGLVNLDEATADKPLDTWSSSPPAAALGGAGQRRRLPRPMRSSTLRRVPRRPRRPRPRSTVPCPSAGRCGPTAACALDRRAALERLRGIGVTPPAHRGRTARPDRRRRGRRPAHPPAVRRPRTTAHTRLAAHHHGAAARNLPRPRSGDTRHGGAPETAGVERTLPPGRVRAAQGACRRDRRGR